MGGPDTPATVSDVRVWRHRIRAAAAALAFPALLTLAGLVLAVAGYFFIFSQFQPYDDEGYFLLCFREVASGRVLYGELFAQYGPFFYWFHWILNRVGLLEYTHDSARLLLLAYWLGAAALAGLTAHRITRRPVLSALTALVAFRVLYRLGYEPGSPQGLCAVLLAALHIAATGFAAFPTAAALAAGAAAGLLLTTKVNVGIFAVLAIGMALSAGTPGRAGTLLRSLSGVAAVTLPPLLMWTHLGLAWGREYATLASLSALTVSLALARAASPDVGVRPWFAALVGFVVAAAAPSAWVLARGTALRQLWHGAVAQHAGFASVMSLAPELPVGTTGLALAGLAAFCVLAFLHDRPGTRHLAEVVVRLARAAVGLVVLYLAYELRHAWLLAAVLPLAWLVVWPAGSGDRHAFSRRLLAALAVTESLAGYPLFGTQRVLATAVLVPLGAVCLADAIAALPALAWPGQVFRPALTAFAAGAGLVAYALYQPMIAIDDPRSMLYPASIAAHYRSAWPLGLPGSDRLRLDSERRAAAYRWLVANLQVHADGFLTVPGLDSLYLWSGVEPPAALNYPAWLGLLDDERQYDALRVVAGLPLGCSVVADEVLTDIPIAIRARSPLCRAANTEFRLAGRFAGYEFRVRAGRPIPELTACARRTPDPQKLVLLVPPAPDAVVGRVQLADALSGHVVADSQPEPGVPELTVRADGPVDRPPPASDSNFDFNASRGLRLQLGLPAGVAGSGPALVVRLYDPRGAYLTSLPVLDAP